jgi:hypothetical protein
MATVEISYARILAKYVRFSKISELDLTAQLYPMIITLNQSSHLQ